MEATDAIPPPISLADRLRGLSPGTSMLFEGDGVSVTSIRSTLTRIKRENPDREYTSKPEGSGGLRVWRLA